MPDVLAVIRPDDFNIALFVHLIGAFVLVGAVATALLALASGWRTGSAEWLRFAYRALSWVGIPAWLVMRVGAELIASKEHLNDEGVDVAWVNIGYSAAEPTFLFLIIATVLARRGANRSEQTEGSGAGLDKGATVLLSIVLVAYVVAIWAMATKPT